MKMNPSDFKLYMGIVAANFRGESIGLVMLDVLQHYFPEIYNDLQNNKRYSFITPLNNIDHFIVWLLT